MKNYLLLLTTILVMGLVGCATEPVENEIVSVPGTFTLNVDVANPSTKVELGDKGDDGYYQMHWSEGDKISANGYVSEDAVINPENTGSAQFEFKNAVLNYPYNVLYPASKEGLVEFATTQYYKEGTFMSGTTPLYAVVANKSNKIALNHLSGVLRFGVVAQDDATTLESLTVTAGEGHIAGTFEVDFANGKLLPTESVYRSFDYSFGEGLTLSKSEAKDIFVVMPSGHFGVCTIELRTTKGAVMVLRFNTTNSAIKAGIVREFKSITFKPGAQSILTPFDSEEDELFIDESTYTVAPTTVDGEYLVINNAKELTWLCYNGAVVNGVTYNKIRIGEDINMGALSALSLPAMKLNAGDEIDGNGKSITGLNMAEDATAIFGDTNNLNIHDLTLNDCSVNTTVQTGAGILVGLVSEGLTVNNVTFNNCSVVAPRMIGLVAGQLSKGVFNISNVTANGGLVETSYVSGKSGIAGGLVGYIVNTAATHSATFTNCTVSTTVKSYMEVDYYFYGKIVGLIPGSLGDNKLYFVSCNAAEAILVPMYDQGKKLAETAVLSFCEARRADFCEATLTSATDNLLGGERYCRGEVYYEGKRFVPEWDGVRTVTMATETVDGITVYYVYSAFDFAAAQGASYGDTKKLVFKTDVDMGGHTFKPIYYVRNLDGENHSVYNVKVNDTQSADNYGAGLITVASSTTTHQNLTIVGADITCNHDSSLPALEYGNDEDGVTGNAYAGVLVSRVKNGTYIASNIHVRNSKVRGVCKVGGLIGVVGATTATIDNCSVDGSIVENYDPKVVNYYTMKKSIASDSYIVEGLQWWYTAGECGGLIGFLNAKSATISNCSVTNTQINCTGQPNKEVYGNVWSASSYKEGAYTNGSSITGYAITTIAGRHVNQFIGDLRSQRTSASSSDYTTTISDYTVSGNTYNGVAADGANDYNHNYASGKYCPVVGCAYYTGVDVKLTVIPVILVIENHVQHYAGTLTFNEKGGSATTLTEAEGEGNNMDWFGGDCTASLGGKSQYPAAPTE